MSNLIGIDSGTSAFRAYEYDENTNEFYSLCQDEVNGIPSLYAVSNVYGEVMIGSKAINCLSLEPENVVRSIKTKLNEKEIIVNGKKYQPQTILNELAKNQIEEINNKYSLSHFFNEKLPHAVLTLPVNFGSNEREIMKEAYEKNGVKIDYIIHEPVAACLYLRNKFKDTKKIIVADIGAGTSDYSALIARGNEFEIMDVSGSYTAGDCFDQTILDYLYKIGKLNGNKNEQEKRIELIAVKEMKEKLSFHDSWCVNIHYPKAPGIMLNMTQDELGEALDEKYDEIVNDLMSFVNKNYSSDMHLLLTGRSSLSPLLQKKIKQSLQEKQITCYFFDTNIIAKGAALYAKEAVKVNRFMVKYNYCLRMTRNDLGKEMLMNLIPAKVSLPYTKTYDNLYTQGSGVAFRIYEVDENYQEYYEMRCSSQCVHEFMTSESYNGGENISLSVQLDENGLCKLSYRINNTCGNSNLRL